MESSSATELKEQKEHLLLSKSSSDVIVSVENESGRSSAASSQETTELNLTNSTGEKVELVWKNVHYVVDNSSNLKKLQNFTKNSDLIELIKNASGKCESGKFMAFLGPSGAGKTTLLECIAGRRTIGVSGKIYVSGAPRAKIAFCAQKDHHLQELTVKESLMFASRLKNYRNSKRGSVKKKWTTKSHMEIVNSIIEQLGLESCIDVRVSGCSGGQLKRLTIGLELVTKPNILLLDEPTSGLDSSSCLQCVKLMQQLARGVNNKPIAVAASLHQPSSQVLHFIDNLYILSLGGLCIYNGPTNDLMMYMKQFELNCPMFQTPTDFAIEVASGDFGGDVINKLVSSFEEKIDPDWEIPSHGVTVTKIVQKTKNQRYPIFLHTWLLFLRTNVVSWRQPQLTTFRLFTYLVVAAMITIIFKNPIGTATGCLSDSLKDFDLTRPGGDAIPNIGFIFFSLLFISLSSQMPTILTFPLEMDVFLKERANGWYSCNTYYIAKSLSDIPYQVFFPLLYCGIVYLTTHQPLDVFRLGMFIMIMILVAFISQTIGLLIGAVFTYDLTSAVYAVALVTAPLILFTGFLVRFDEMPEYLHPLSYTTYMRYSMEAILTVIFGFDRCKENLPTFEEVKASFAPDTKKLIKLMDYLTENDMMPDVIWLMNKNMTRKYNMDQSYVVQVFDLRDDWIWINIAVLVGYMMLIRFVGYFVLLWKANRKK